MHSARNIRARIHFRSVYFVPNVTSTQYEQSSVYDVLIELIDFPIAINKFNFHIDVFGVEVGMTRYIML
jgi:hypothetical protein